MSIPTPPHSPCASAKCLPSAPLDGTEQMLQTLVSFYEKERIWITNARTKLRQMHLRESSPPRHWPSPPPSEIDEESPTPAKSVASATLRDKLGTANRKLSHRPPIKAGGGRQMAPRDKERIAAMFERMVQIRLESCERVLRLVREANRPECPHS